MKFELIEHRTLVGGPWQGSVIKIPRGEFETRGDAQAKVQGHVIEWWEPMSYWQRGMTEDPSLLFFVHEKASEE